MTLRAAEQQASDGKSIEGFVDELVAFLERGIAEAFAKPDAPDVLPRIAAYASVQSADIAFQVQAYAKQVLAPMAGRVRFKIERDRVKGHPFIAVVVTLIDVPRPAKVGAA